MSANITAPVAAQAVADLKIVGPQPAASSPQAAAPGSVRAGGRHGRWVVAILIALVVAVVAAAGWRTTRATTPVHYVTAAVSRGTVARAVTGSGTVNPVTTVQVGTYVSGVIQQLFCDYNTPVKKGQLCAKIDPRPYQTVVDQARANLSTANAQRAKDEANLAYAKITYDRALDLRQRGIVPQDTADSAKSAYDQARTQVDLDASTIEQHRAVLDASQINLGYTNIVSPVNGTVVSRNVTMGQTVAASFQTPTLFLIAADLANMQVDANVSESDIGGVTLGDAVSFTVEAFPDRTFQGRVVQVRQAPQAVQNVITYDVVISAPNPELLLKPGMTATTRIVIDHRDNVMRVPDQALRYSPGGVAGGAPTSTASATSAPAEEHARGAGYVWVLRDGRPTHVAVSIGLDDDAYAEITAGDLKVGDQIVLSEQSGPAGVSQSKAPFFRL